LPENIHQETFHPKMHNKDFTKGQKGKIWKMFFVVELKELTNGQAIKNDLFI